MKLSTCFTALAGLSASTFASPLQSYNIGACAKVNDIVLVLHAQRSATSFCSSFLHISASTKTLTSVATKTAATIKTVTGQPQTHASTVPVTITNYATQTTDPVVTQVVQTEVTGTAVVQYTVTEIYAPTSTVTTSTTTIYTFLPGNPPPATTVAPLKRNLPVEAEADDECEAPSPPHSYPQPQPEPPKSSAYPSYLKPFPSGAISTACSCLSIPTPTATVYATQVVTVNSASTKTLVPTTIVTISNTATLFSTQVVTIPTTATVIQPSTVTVTVAMTVAATVIADPTTTYVDGTTTITSYPCATPLINYAGPAYGDYSSPANLGLQNQIFYSTTPQGSSAAACCNTCYFGLSNCVQAYWYNYQGCVVSRATSFGSASGEGVSEVCPEGTFLGLAYGPDANPAFRSTGNIAGPCGQGYTKF